MQILHVSCSPRGQASESHRLARKIIGFLQRGEPGAVVVDRIIGDGSLPHIDGDYAAALGAAQAVPAESSQTGSIATSEAIIREVESADVVVIGTPMHNFGVPSALKAWVDHVVRVRRTFDAGSQGKIARLRDRPVFIAVSSGGMLSGDGPHQPDFLTPYLQAVLAVVGLHNLTFFSVEGTGMGPDGPVQARARADRALQRHFDPVLGEMQLGVE